MGIWQGGMEQDTLKNIPNEMLKRKAQNDMGGQKWLGTKGRHWNS